MIAQLFNTAKEISSVNIQQSPKLRPIFTGENETKPIFFSGIKTNQRERERSSMSPPIDNTVETAY